MSIPAADWTDVCPTSELLPGDFLSLEIDDLPVAVFNIDGEFYAIEDVCTHDGEQLTGGPIEGCQIECPRHGARFDIRTGQALTPPAYEPTASLPIRIAEGIIQVRDDRWD